MHLQKSIKDGMCVDFVQFGLDDYIPFVTINKSERSDFKAIQNKCAQCQYWYFYSLSEVCYACGLMNKLVVSVFFRASLFWSCTPAGLWFAWLPMQSKLLWWPAIRWPFPHQKLVTTIWPYSYLFSPISILLLNVKYIILCHSIAHLIEAYFSESALACEQLVES